MAEPARRAIAFSAVLSLVLVGCSSSKPHAKPSSSSLSSATAPSTSISLSPVPITPLPSSPIPSTPAERAATDALLSPAQLPNFQEIPWSLTPVPQPCLAADTRPVFVQAPPKTLVGRQFSLASPPGILTEQLAVYANAGEAKAASDIASRGLACAQGNFYDSDGSAQQVTIAGPADLRAILGTDAQAASSWTLQNGELTDTLLLIVDQQAFIMLSFVASTQADLSKLPSGKVIAQLALANVRDTKLVAPAPASSTSAASSSPKSSASSRH